jgi:MFS family permease
MSTEATFAKSAASTQERHRWWLFAACVLISLTNEVSNAVTNLSLGPMRSDLGASSAVMQIAVTLGKLMLGAFMLAGGVAGDIYGRRRILVLGALGIVGASLLAAAAQTGGWRAGFLLPAAVAALGGLGVFGFASRGGAKTQGRRLDGIGALTPVLPVCWG